MSAELTKTARIRSPNDLGQTPNDFGGRLYTATTTTKVNAIPSEWADHWVIIHNRGPGSVQFAFSQHADAVITTAAVATDAGESDEVAPEIASGERQQRWLPKKLDDGASLYLVRRAVSGTASLHLELGDGQ